MKYLNIMLTAILFVVSVSAWGQGGSMSRQPDSSLKQAPVDPGMRTEPDSSMRTPSDRGAVVVPPKTDPDAIATPPKNIDPEITAPTKEIDKKNRQKSEDKEKLQ